MKNDLTLKYIISAILIIVLATWFIKCDMPRELLYTDLSEYSDDDKAQTPTLNIPKGHYDLCLNYSSTSDCELVVYKDDHSPLFISIAATGGEPSVYELSVDLLHGYDYFRLSVSDKAVNNITFNSFFIKSSRPLYFDKIIILAISVILIMAWFYLAFLCDRSDKSMYKKFCNHLNIDTASILLLLVAFIIASIPCFNSYLINTKGQDLLGHISRTEGIKDGLISGQFPVQLYPSSYWGFGILGSIYPSLFTYIPAIIRLIFHSSVVLSWNLFLMLINIITLISMYYCISTITNRNRILSTVATIVYLLAPYRLNNMYVRSAVGEAMAMAFFPLVIAGLFLVFCINNQKEDINRNYFPLVIGLTCILHSHLISIVYAALICVIFGLVFIKELFKKETILALLKGALLVILLSCSYIIPYLSYIHSDRLNLEGLDRKMYNTALNLEDLFRIVPLRLSDCDSLSTFHSLGIIGAILFITVFVIYIKKIIIKKEVAIDNAVIFSIVSLILSLIFVYLSTRYTPWRTLHNIPFVGSLCAKFQFPWRFLSLTTLFVTVSLAIVINKTCKADFEKYFKNINIYSVITLLITIVAVISTIPLYCALSGTTTRITKTSGAITEGRLDEYLPYTDNRDQTWAYRTYATLSDYDAIAAANYNKEFSTISFEYSANKEDLYIDMPLTFYSDYVAYEMDGDNNRVDLKTGMGKYETLRVYINKHEEMRPVLVYFKVPLHAYIGIIISLIGCILFIICLLSFRRKLPKSNS